MSARLSFVNYYRLSAYWWSFRKQGTGPQEKLDEFIEGTEFDRVWDHYVFDQKLRILGIEAIERIEVATRTQLAYHHSRTWGPDAYASNPASLPRHRNHTSFLEKLEELVKQNEKTPFVRHFLSKYKKSRHLPIWMAVELMSLGNVVSMYQGSDDNLRDQVANTVANVPNATFASWLLTLLNVRNICAHHGRLWNRKLAKIPIIPSSSTRPEWHQPPFDNKKIYAALTICNYLLTRISDGQSSWATRLNLLIQEHPRIPISAMGFPRQWTESLLWGTPPTPKRD